MATPRQQQGGLSLTTLVIASSASVAAAIVVHEVWQGGAILGAAITPVIVAIVSESLRKPVDRVSALREERRARTSAGRRTPREAPTAPPPELERADPFGIWQEDRVPWYRRLDRRHLKLALVTGLAAFAIGAVALTATELVFGGSVGSGGGNSTLGGGGRDSRDEEEKTTTETQPAETTTETTPAAPEEQQTTTTPETTPTTPQTTPPTTTPTQPSAPPPTTQPPAGTPPAPAPTP